MPLRADLLTPIPGDNPSGPDIRYDAKLPIYDQLKEARRQDDDLAQGDWQRERKVADYPRVIRLTQDALATKTKDLQLAAWLVEANLRTHGFPGLAEGLRLCHGLVVNFWETLNPPLEDGDEEPRMGHLEWVGSALEIPLKSVALTAQGHDWFKFKESRLVGYEEQAKTDKEKKLRTQRVSEGKLTPEVFDKAVAETPKAFYLRSEKDLDLCLEALADLDVVCEQKFTTSRPSFAKLRSGLEEVRLEVHGLLQKKRETEPDPVEEVPAEALPEGQAEASTAPGAQSASPSISFSVLTSSEPADRREAIASVAKVAAFLRKREPFSPAPYLMMRGLRWGELRSAPQLADPTLLEAPPTELRQHLKRLALSKRWNELLEAAENTMSLPCSRAWLDLQRLVVGACTALGSDYDAIAAAIRSELRALLNDVPQLLDANLLDDTPAANAETRAWLEQLDGTSAAASIPAAVRETVSVGSASNGHRSSSWLERAADPYVLAKEAQKAGQSDKAFEIMRREIARQTSGRGRFERTMQLVELCVTAGKEAIAQPLLDDIASAIEVHKLDDWEDKEMVARALATLMTTSKKIQQNASERQKLFERICRLDPVRALNAG
jgi:type VI secretion system protein ImpA